MRGAIRPGRGKKPPADIDPDPVELAGKESFPASDPPSWIPVRVGRPLAAGSPTASKVPTQGLAEARHSSDRAGTERSPAPRKR